MQLAQIWKLEEESMMRMKKNFTIQNHFQSWEDASPFILSKVNVLIQIDTSKYKEIFLTLSFKHH